MKLYKFSSGYRVMGNLIVWVCARSASEALTMLVNRRRKDGLPFQDREDWQLMLGGVDIEPGLMIEVTE